MSDPDRPAEARKDPYLDGCVLCGRRTVSRRDFCEDCIERGEDDDNFGRCYVCRDFHDHEHCIGVPCQCPCPPPDQRQREALRASAAAKLTPEERHALGLI